jgi:hypothetical protein
LSFDALSGITFSASPVAGRDDPIRMKLARGRPVDRADVATLTDDEA